MNNNLLRLVLGLELIYRVMVKVKFSLQSKVHCIWMASHQHAFSKTLILACNIMLNTNYLTLIKLPREGFLV